MNTFGKLVRLLRKWYIGCRWAFEGAKEDAASSGSGHAVGGRFYSSRGCSRAITSVWPFLVAPQRGIRPLSSGLSGLTPSRPTRGCRWVIGQTG